MSIERQEKIRQYRLKQPLNELQRKADIALNKNKTWTQEEFDAADAEANRLLEFLNRAGGDASHSSEK